MLNGVDGVGDTLGKLYHSFKDKVMFYKRNYGFRTTISRS